jgi:hypothetical protein
MSQPQQNDSQLLQETKSLLTQIARSQNERHERDLVRRKKIEEAASENAKVQATIDNELAGFADQFDNVGLDYFTTLH